MDRETALTVLRLSSVATEAEVTAAYVKLVRRYPLESAPDRFREIQEAYQVLKSSALYWLRKIDEDTLDLRYLRKYLINKQNSGVSNSKGDFKLEGESISEGEETAKECKKDFVSAFEKDQVQRFKKFWTHTLR